MVEFFNTHLLTLIKNKGNVEEVISIIERRKWHLVFEKSTRNSLLHYAAKWNNVDVAKYLVETIKTEQVSLLNEWNDDLKPPLEYAALNRCKDMAEILVEAGADILSNEKIKCALNIVKIFKINNWLDGRMLGKLLGKCNLSNDEEIADGLLEYRWPLHCVVLLGNANLTKLVLDRQYSPDIDKKDKAGNTALHIATENADVENVKLLLSYNANVRVEDKNHYNSISYVYRISVGTKKLSRITKNEHPECPDERFAIAKMLLENYGSLLNDYGLIEKNVGHLLMRGKKEVIELLLQSVELEDGLDLNVDHFKCSVFELLVKNRNPGIIEQLNGKNVNIKNRNYLICAVRANNVTAVELLLDRGADVNAGIGKSMSPLMEAIKSWIAFLQLKYRDCVQVLLEHQANAQNPIFAVAGQQQTILDYLSYLDHLHMSELVLDQLALQKAKGTPIIEMVKKTILSREEFRTYFELSEKQLNVQFCKSITLFSLLTDSNMKIERYVYNEELFSKFTNFSTDESSKFYFFKTFLKKRLKKVDEYAKLRRKSAHIISKIMDVEYERFPAVTDQIASYLRKEDMKNLLSSFSE